MKVNNPHNKFILKPNPKLFNSDLKEELEGNTYYAYLDTVESINGQFHIRFDCIIKTDADKITINKDTILEFPSVVIELIGNINRIRNKFNYNNLHLLESSWLLLQTSIQYTELIQEQYFNFVRVGNEEVVGNYDVDNITLYRDMDVTSQSKVVEIRNATTLDESTQTEVEAFFSNIDLTNFSHINVYNVGQGNCIGLVDKANVPLLYNDVGGGSGANSKTYPTAFKLCTSNNPPVILSHWDMDHIQTAAFDDNILNSKWLVPKQKSLSNTAIHIALELQRRGNLICWKNTITHFDFSSHRVSKCSGNPNNKNNSGLSLFVNNGNGEFVLLPGDATYNKITHLPVPQFLGLVASHHGSKGAIARLPRPLNPFSMLVYSFGDDNTHDHPTAGNSYINRGWSYSKNTTSGNIGMIRNPTNLNSSCTDPATLNIDEHF